MATKVKDKQTTVHKTQHRKVKTEQHEPKQKLGVIADVQSFKPYTENRFWAI